MKQTVIKHTIAIAAIIGGLTGACSAGFLRRTYQGSFIAHDHKYVVNVDGSIDLQTIESNWTTTSIVGCGCLLPVCCPNDYTYGQGGSYQTIGRTPDWTTEVTFSNEEELKHVIGDLQEVQKEIDTQEK